MKRLTVFSLVVYFLTTASAASYDGVVRAVGDGRYEAYMIPPFNSNHASFIEQLPNGRLVLAWFSGTKEGGNDVAIVLSHLPPNSTQWSQALLVSQRDGYSNQNPVLFYDALNQELNLFHSQQQANAGESQARVWHLTSQNMGANWSTPLEIFKVNGSFDRNRIIKSLDSGLIFPIYYSVKGDENEHSSMKLSRDHVTWVGYKVDDSNFLVQPSVIRPTPGKQFLRVYFRDCRAQHIYSSTSVDEGKTWTEPKKTSLPNNNAAIQSTVLTNGHVALLYNPTTSSRNPLRVSISEDGGMTWAYSKDLEHSSSDDVEFSYPSIIQTPDGFIHVSYTYNRDTIKYVKFREDWIHK